MNKRIYDEVYPQLKTLQDVEQASQMHHISAETLRVLLTQKIVRETRRKHFKLKSNARKLLRIWREGASSLSVSRRFGFSPVMMASIVLLEQGVSRSLFRKYLNDPALISDGRVRREVEECLEHELVYSPSAYGEQLSRSKVVEGKVSEWFLSHGVSFKTEVDSRKENKKKTPDFLLEEPLFFSGEKVFWVECKATFGDFEEVRRDFRKQLSHYLELFGPGAVVYWYGFLEGGVDREGLLVLSKSSLIEHLKHPFK